MSLPTFLETRWLKRGRLGAPDVYLQDPKQKEDELTSVNVKQGFINPPPFNDEYSSAHLYSIDANKITQSFTSLLSQKQILNTYNDAGKKRPQVAKEHFSLVPVINSKIRGYLHNWIKDLSSTTPLSHLSKRVPVFTKKEDIFQSLAECEVPLVRATWFIKMTAAYPLTQTDAKIKKRTTNDPNSDWTQAICKFMREQLAKLNENTASRPNGGLSTHINTIAGSVGVSAIFYTGSNPTTITRDDLEKQLQYISNLAHHMYSEGLLDRHEFLTWIVDEFESISLHDEIALSYFMPFILQYVEEAVMNQLLSRRMSFAAANHLNWIFLECSTSRSGSPMQSGRNTPANMNHPMQSALHPTSTQIQQQCPPHLYSIAHTLSCVIQCTVLSCPGALVWYPPNDPKLCGSPMDLLPCAPSALMLPDIPEDDAVAQQEANMFRQFITDKEKEIVQRSHAAEMRWSSDKCQESTAGHTINRVLSALEALDKQTFDRGDPLELLYHKIFDQSHCKENDQIIMSSEDAVIGLLCEWAITSKRLGEHRATVVAKLLDLRQAHYEKEINTTNHSSNVHGHSDTLMDQTIMEDSPLHQKQAPRMTPYFQNLLFMFLDTQAPELKNPGDADELQAFKNLVLLFSELIEHDVFAHDQYMNTLISRGDVSPGQFHSFPSYLLPQSEMNASAERVGVHATTGSSLPEDKHTMESLKLDDSELMHDIKMETNDLDFLSNTESVFSPDSRCDRHFLDAVRPVEQNSKTTKSQTSFNSSKSPHGVVWGYGQPRHVQFLMHFPIPSQCDGITYEWNQRLMVLYGAGRQKTLVKRAVRKVTRHLTKLIQNKCEIERKQGYNGASKKIKPSTTSSLNDLLCRYKALSYFDQHMITSNAAKALLSSLNNYISGRVSCLPHLHVIILLFDLMEEALNIGGLVQTAVSVCSCLTRLSAAIQCKQNSVGAAGQHRWYATELSLVVVAILKHYQSYLTLNSDLAIETFDCLLSFTKQSCLSSPAQCTSADRSILVFLYDLYVVLSYIRVQYADAFGGYIDSIRQTLCSTKKPATSNCRYDPGFLQEYIKNPLKELESALSIAERYSVRLHDMTCRYSFVCTAVITVCSGQQNLDKVNALAALCAEMNARCNELSAEWLGVLKALCCSSCAANFNDVLVDVEASDSQIHDPLALFTAVLIARGCLSLEDVIQYVAIPSLLTACNNKPAAGLTNPDTGARLTCHLLLQLFKAPSPNISNSKNSFHLPSSCDRHLLAAAQHNIAVGAVLAVLKAMLKLGDAGLSFGKSTYPHDGDVSVTSFFAPIRDFDDFDDINMTNRMVDPSHDKESRNTMNGTSLSEFAKHAIRVICAQQWVRERCLKDPDMDLLMDPLLTREQQQNLIQLICYPEDELKRLSALNGDPRTYIVSILSEMTRWTLRQCLLELQAMIRQSPQEKSLPEHIAKATIEVFQQQQQQQIMESTRERKSLTGPELDRCNVWLVAPLVSKLPSQVQGRVLQEASTILEAPQNWSCTSTRSGASVRADRHENNYSGSSLLNHQPFLTLILTCLKGQDDQRDSLLESLQSQIIMLHTEWQSARSQRDVGKDVACFGSSQNGVHDALQLRLSLVGGMFDTVQSNSQWTSDVVVLLTQLINSGMVDSQVNTELFNIVYDMIAVLLHQTLGGDIPNRAEGSKREYMNIVKKMKKEIGEHQTESVCKLRQLLPIQRIDLYVVCCEPIGPLVDTKAGRLPVPVDGNHGLQVSSKQKLNVWEIIEGLKHPAPLCYTWFGARKTERKKLCYEEEHSLLLHHQHGKRSLSEFLKPPLLPPEEDEVIPPPVKTPQRKTSIKMNMTGSNTISSTRTDDMKPPQKISKTKRPSKSRPKAVDPNAMQFSRIQPIANTGATNTGVLNHLGSQLTQNTNFGFNAPNPPSYPYQTQNTLNTSINTNTYPGASGFPTTQQHLANKQGRQSKQALGQMLRQRLQGTQGRLNNTGNLKPSVHMAHDMYNNPSQARQSHLIQQQQNPSYTNYTHPQKTQQTIVPNYNSGTFRSTVPASQLPYQQSNVAGGLQNTQYIGQQPMRNTNNYGMPQNNTFINQQPTMMGMQSQSQQPQQYTVNQHTGRNAQLTRLPHQQLRVHHINTSQGMQQSGTINQRQMFDQHQQIINNSQQYGQQIQNTQQQSGNMMDIRRNMQSQQSQY